MTTLILLLPQRSRLRPQGREATSFEAAGARGEFSYVFSTDGRHVESQGRAAAALLPRADVVIACPADADLSWHRVTLPRIARTRMRSALAGLLEEELLDDPEQLHFALEPEAQGGESAWVAVCHRAWLAEQLQLLDQAQIVVDRIQPLSWPQASARGHFFHIESVRDGATPPLGLCWSQESGVASLCLNGSLARDLIPPAAVQAAHWTGTAESIAAAEHWLGAAVTAQSDAERALAALAGPWDLRQFELAPHARGSRALREFYRGLMSPRWQPARWGLLALVLVQLLGLNLWAWQQRQQLEARRSAMSATLSSAFPKVRAILDAPVQMRRETELLRAAAGRPGEQDFETLLAAAATAWPPERGPVDALSFEPGRLTISANGWSPAQIQQFERQLRSEGWQLQTQDGRMALSRAPSP